MSELSGHSSYEVDFPSTGVLLLHVSVEGLGPWEGLQMLSTKPPIQTEDFSSRSARAHLVPFRLAAVHEPLLTYHRLIILRANHLSQITAIILSLREAGFALSTCAAGLKAALNERIIRQTECSPCQSIAGRLQGCTCKQSFLTEGYNNTYFDFLLLPLPSPNLSATASDGTAHHGLR